MSQPQSAIRLGSALAALAVARGGLLDEAQAVVYLRLLQDGDTGLLERACEALAREPRGEFEPLMPAVGAILERSKAIRASDAQQAARDKLLPLPANQDEEPRFFCRDCWDESSGWRVIECDGRRTCGRTKAHQPHLFAVRCECWQRNPVVVERNMAQYPKKTA